MTTPATPSLPPQPLRVLFEICQIAKGVLPSTQGIGMQHRTRTQLEEAAALIAQLAQPFEDEFLSPPSSTPTTEPVHNHGAEGGPGLACREFRVAGRLLGECRLPVCPACGGSSRLTDMGNRAWLSCQSCGKTTDTMRTADGAVAEWSGSSLVESPRESSTTLCKCGHEKHDGPCERAVQTKGYSGQGIYGCPCIEYRPSSVESSENKS